MIDQDVAKGLAKELKIDLFTIYREYLQLLFLKYFYEQKGSEETYFKGGTAIHFLFDSFRFSEDLDFTSLLPKEKLKTLIDKTLYWINKEASAVNFKQIPSIANSFSGKLIQQLPFFKFSLTTKLDFSLREIPLYPDTSYLETIFPIGPYPQISHLKEEELLAEKVRALLIRGKGRDVFDLWFLLSKKVKLNWELINKKMELYQKKASQENLIQIIQKLSQEEIKLDLAKFLPLSQRGLAEKVKMLVLEKLEVF